MKCSKFVVYFFTKLCYTSADCAGEGLTPGTHPTPVSIRDRTDLRRTARFQAASVSSRSFGIRLRAVRLTLNRIEPEP